MLHRALSPSVGHSPCSACVYHDQHAALDLAAQDLLPGGEMSEQSW